MILFTINPLEWVHSIPGGGHLIAAIIALVTGPILFMRHKATVTHRMVGYVFILSMLVTNVSALLMYDFTGYPNLFHFFALLSLYSLLPGIFYLVKYIRTRDIAALELHGRLMVWAYYGLAAAGFAQMASRILPTYTGSFTTSFAIIGATLGLAGVIANWKVKSIIAPLVDRYGTPAE